MDCEDGSLRFEDLLSNDDDSSIESSFHGSVPNNPTQVVVVSLSVDESPLSCRRVIQPTIGPNHAGRDSVSMANISLLGTESSVESGLPADFVEIGSIYNVLFHKSIT